MAKVGYHAHWDTSGKKPWQRYTEAGGRHNVGENLNYCRLPTEEMFSAEELEGFESSFMDEKPPDDGHRKQILKPQHNKHGVGLSYSVDGRISHLYLAQEFVDQYGEYSKLPSKIVSGQPFKVEGYLFPSVKFNSVVVAWEPAPKPMTKDELSKTHSCIFDGTTVDNLSPSDTPNVKVWSEGGHQHFSVQVTPDKDCRPGLYYVLIQAILVKSNQLIIVSTRTTELD